MKAIYCQSFTSGSLQLAEASTPEIADDEVLVKVHYAGVNFPDTLIIQGKYQFRPDLPFAPGQEVSGVVEATGAEVSHVKKGDRVLASMTWGGFAELAVARAMNVYKLPEKLDFREAAGILETYATALYALKDRAFMKPGETLLVLGASGGTGTAAVQLGHLFGARVLAVASTPEKRQFALSNGADAVLEPGDELKEQLKTLGGVDVIFDPVGGALAETTFRALKSGGRHLVVGFASGEIPAIPFNLPLLKSAAIVGVFWGHFWRTQPLDNRRNVSMLLRWFAEEKLTVGVTTTYRLEEAQQAIDDLTNRKAIGKILLQVNGSS